MGEKLKFYFFKLQEKKSVTCHIYGQKNAINLHGEHSLWVTVWKIVCLNKHIDSPPFAESQLRWASFSSFAILMDNYNLFMHFKMYCLRKSKALYFFDVDAML